MAERPGGATPGTMRSSLRRAPARIRLLNERGKGIKAGPSTHDGPSKPRLPSASRPYARAIWSEIMSIVVRCSCGKNLKVKDEFGGKQVTCPACRHAVAV